MSLPAFLQDKVFLLKIDNLHIKLQFVKVTVLSWNELPLELVQGKVISGNVNLDGSSSMRRTANLSIFAEEKENNLANIDQLFSINKKCKLLLGIVNTLSKTVVEGIEIKNKKLQFFSKTIDYQKMYGDIVWFPLGIYIMFNPSISHSTTGVSISIQLKDKMCLLNGDLAGVIHSSVDFAYQDLVVDINSNSIEKKPVLIYNIIKELVNHWGNENLSKIVISEVPLKIKQVVKWMGRDPIYLIQNITSGSYFLKTAEEKQSESNYILIGTFEYGLDMGYIYSDFTYPGKDLVCNIGDTVTSVLDKIISIMGNYEYFYDVEGNFIFREKQNSLNMSNTAYWDKQTKKLDNISVNENISINLPMLVYLADTYRLSKSVYNFTNNSFTISFNNSLNFNNIKNDFVVWGCYTSITGLKYPCRFHLAIDKKPNIKCEHTIKLYMDDYLVTRAAAALEDEEGAIKRLSSDWREEIYYQMLEDLRNGTGTDTELNNTYFQYYAELKLLFPKMFDLNTKNGTKSAIGWKDFVKSSPEQIVYFLDFIEENSELGQYSVNNIGRRAKVIDSNNEGINCVFEPNIPDIVYIEATSEAESQTTEEARLASSYGTPFTQILPAYYDLLSVGGSLNSCFEKIKDLLYQYTHVNNTISITTLPIYYLLPNTRITIEDAASGIYGDYIIQSISLPLDVSSTMSINAYKALQKI